MRGPPSYGRARLSEIKTCPTSWPSIISHAKRRPYRSCSARLTSSVSVAPYKVIAKSIALFVARAIHRSKDRRHEALWPAPTLSIVREKFPDPFFHSIQVCRRRARARSNKPKQFRKNRNEGLIMAQIETQNRKTIELWEVWTTSNEGDAWTFLGRFDTAQAANIEALNHSLAGSVQNEFGPKREYKILPIKMPVGHPNPYHRPYIGQLDELPF